MYNIKNRFKFLVLLILGLCNFSIVQAAIKIGGKRIDIGMPSNYIDFDVDDPSMTSCNGLLTYKIKPGSKPEFISCHQDIFYKDEEIYASNRLDGASKYYLKKLPVEVQKLPGLTVHKDSFYISIKGSGEIDGTIFFDNPSYFKKTCARATFKLYDIKGRLIDTLTTEPEVIPPSACYRALSFNLQSQKKSALIRSVVRHETIVEHIGYKDSTLSEVYAMNTRSKQALGYFIFNGLIVGGVSSICYTLFSKKSSPPKPEPAKGKKLATK